MHEGEALLGWLPARLVRDAVAGSDLTAAT